MSYYGAAPYSVNTFDVLEVKMSEQFSLIFTSTTLNLAAVPVNMGPFRNGLVATKKELEEMRNSLGTFLVPAYFYLTFAQ